MIYKAAHNAVCICCDECEREPEVGFLTFREAAQWAKDKNWKFRKAADGEWENICPHCARQIGLLPPDEAPTLPTLPEKNQTATMVKYGGRNPDF